MLVVILAAALVALVGYICVAPDQFGFLRLPHAFLQLGAERTVTGLSLMLLGFLIAFAEAGGGKRKTRAGARPFAFGEESPGPAAAELRLEPEPPQPVPDAQVTTDPPAPLEPPLTGRRPDLYEQPMEEDPAAAVPKSDIPPPSPQLEP